MSLTLGKSFNRQYKLRLPFRDYFYDISVFYHTDINFNLFDINPIMKYNSNKDLKAVNINMFKNIESSDFCINCLDLKTINNRLSKYENIKDEWKNDITCVGKERVNISSDNYLKVITFRIKSYNNIKDDFIFLLVERKNYLKKYKDDRITTTLSGIQIATNSPIDYIKSENQNQFISSTVITNDYDTNTIIKL